MKNEVYLGRFIPMLEQELGDEIFNYVTVDGTILDLFLIPKSVMLDLDF